MGYAITWEPPSGVIKRHFGHVTGQELLQAIRTTEADPRFDTLRYVINDFLECTGLSVSQSEFDDISAIDAGAAMSNPRIRIAVVATRPDVVAIARAYANDPITAFDTRVFDTMDEARVWLSRTVTQAREGAKGLRRKGL